MRNRRIQLGISSFDFIINLKNPNQTDMVKFLKKTVLGNDAYADANRQAEKYDGSSRTFARWEAANPHYVWAFARKGLKNSLGIHKGSAHIHKFLLNLWMWLHKSVRRAGNQRIWKAFNKEKGVSCSLVMKKATFDYP